MGSYWRSHGPLGRRVDGIRQLPAYPAEGSRDNKVPKFDGDTLGWEEDDGGTGGGTGLRATASQQATPTAQDRFFFTDENQPNDPLRYVPWDSLVSGVVTDDSVLDAAQSSRGSGDRGKLLGTADGNENDLVLVDNPNTQVFRGRGVFAVRTAYAVNDVVTYNGHLYYVAVAVPASNTSNPVDGSTWVLLSADPTPTATTTRQGTVEAATQTEMNAGSGNRFPAANIVKTYVDAQAAAVASPVTIISNIASYDAAQNRFEDSGGNEVTVPNGVIVTLTEAVYDAAVADAGFTPNPNAVFLAR